MFIGEDAQPNDIEKDKLQRQVNHYRGNIINIVNKMRKFVDGYQQVPVAETNSSESIFVHIVLVVISFIIGKSLMEGIIATRTIGINLFIQKNGKQVVSVKKTDIVLRYDTVQPCYHLQ